MKKILIFDSNSKRAKEMQCAFAKNIFFRYDDCSIKKVNLDKGEFETTDNYEFDICLAHTTDWFEIEQSKKVADTIKCKFIVFYGGKSYNLQRKLIGNDALLINRIIIDSNFLAQIEAQKLILLSENFTNEYLKSELPKFLQPCDLVLNELLENFYNSLKNSDLETAQKIKVQLTQYDGKQ